MNKLKKTLLKIFRNVILISSIVLLPACTKSKVSENQTFTLYRNSANDENMRLHIATFDANESTEYNRENCENTQSLYQNQFMIKTKFWCEKGLYQK